MGIGSRVGSTDFWMWTAILVFGATLVAVFFHILSVALLSPASANWAPRVRGYLTAVWLIAGVMASTTPWRSIRFVAWDLELWIIYTLMLLIGVLLISVCEKNALSLRIRRSIPRSRIKRALVFGFFSGPVNGIVWTIVIMSATIMGGLLMSPDKGGMRISADESLLVGASVFLYSYSYALISLFIRRKGLTWINPQNTWVVVLSVLALGHLGPIFVILMMGVTPWPNVLYGNLLQIIADPDYNDALDHLPAALIGAGVTTFLNLPWFLKQIVRFAPPSENNRIEVKAANVGD